MKETVRKADERDSRSAELRAQLEADAATLRKAQKAVETERAVQKVHYSISSWSLRFFQTAFAAGLSLVHLSLVLVWALGGHAISFTVHDTGLSAHFLCNQDSKM